FITLGIVIVGFTRRRTQGCHHVRLTKAELRSDTRVRNKAGKIHVLFDTGIFQDSLRIEPKGGCRNYVGAHNPCRVDDRPSSCKLVISDKQRRNAQRSRDNELGARTMGDSQMWFRRENRWHQLKCTNTQPQQFSRSALSGVVPYQLVVQLKALGEFGYLKAVS